MLELEDQDQVDVMIEQLGGCYSVSSDVIWWIVCMYGNCYQVSWYNNV